MAKLETLRQRVYRAERTLELAIAERFVAGLTVHLDDSNNTPLTVLETYRNRVKVRNDRSDKEYWLYATRLRESNTL